MNFSLKNLFKKSQVALAMGVVCFSLQSEEANATYYSSYSNTSYSWSYSSNYSNTYTTNYSPYSSWYGSKYYTSWGSNYYLSNYNNYYTKLLSYYTTKSTEENTQKFEWPSKKFHSGFDFTSLEDLRKNRFDRLKTLKEKIQALMEKLHEEKKDDSTNDDVVKDDVSNDEPPILYTREYWLDYFETECPSFDELSGITLGVNFTAGECGSVKYLLNHQDIFGNSMEGNIVYKLAAEMLASKLSIQLEGRPICGNAESALIVAGDWMTDIMFDGTQSYEDIDDFTRGEMSDLKEILLHYNEGGVCDGQEDIEQK